MNENVANLITNEDYTEHWNAVTQQFELFKQNKNKDENIQAILDLTKLIEELKLFYYNFDFEYQWNTLLALLFSKEETILKCSLEELEEAFEKVQVSTLTDINNINNLIVYIDRYSRNYNLSIRHLIRYNHN